MLFVDNDKTEGRKIDSILYDGMSTDQDTYIPCEQTGKDGFTFLPFHRTGKQFHTDIHTEKKLLYRFVMLVGKNFRRGHHTSLITIIKCHQHTH